MVDSGQNEGELVATHPGHGVTFANCLGEFARHLLEQLIAAGVPDRVVDRLEAVEIEEHNRDLLAAASRLREIDA